MAKYIQFQISGYCAETDAQGVTSFVESPATVTLPYSEANLAAAQENALNGEFTTYDDGVQDIIIPTAQDDTDAMLIDHEYRLTLLELGLLESEVNW